MTNLANLLTSKDPHQFLRQWGEHMGAIRLPEELLPVVVVCAPEDADTFVSAFLEKLAKFAPKEKTHLACFWQDSTGVINRQYVEPFEAEDIRSLVLVRSVLVDAQSVITDIRQLEKVSPQTLIIIAPVMSSDARESIITEFPNASFIFFEDTDTGVDVGALLGLDRAPYPEIIKERQSQLWYE